MGRFSPTVLPDGTNPFAVALSQGVGSFLQARGNAQEHRAALDRQKMERERMDLDRASANDRHAQLASELERAAYERSQRGATTARQKAADYDQGIEDAPAPIALPLGGAVSPFGFSLTVPAAQAFPGRYQDLGDGRVLNTERTPEARRAAEAATRDTLARDQFNRQAAADKARVDAELKIARGNNATSLEVARLNGTSREAVARARGVDGTGRSASTNIGTEFKTATARAQQYLDQYGGDPERVLSDATPEDLADMQKYGVTPSLLRGVAAHARTTDLGAVLKAGQSWAASDMVPLDSGIKVVQGARRSLGMGAPPAAPLVPQRPAPAAGITLGDTARTAPPAAAPGQSDAFARAADRYRQAVDAGYPEEQARAAYDAMVRRLSGVK